MKTIVMLMLLMTMTGFAQEEMTEDEQYDYVERQAKKFRRDLWRSGHEDVESYYQPMSWSDVDEYIDPLTNSEYEQPLDDDQIESIKKCMDLSHCKLYAVFVSGSYYSGYATQTHFILLYTKSRKHWEIKHLVYAE